MTHSDIQDYIKGRLTATNLKAAERRFAAMSDEEINRLLDASEDNSENIDVEAKCLHARLLDTITPQKPKQFRLSISRMIAVAAVAIISILAASTVYLFVRTADFTKYESALAREIVVTTSNGEATRTILPDGTEVYLGPESRIAYKLASFNDSERTVNFDGEAAFEVAKNTKAPFTVEARNFDIHVLGTGFSVMSREDIAESQVYLKHGSIELQSAKTDNRVIMVSGQSAIITSTGDIAICDKEDSSRLSVGNNIMYFSSAPLGEVAQRIERYYGCSVAISKELTTDICFTGSLPTDNLYKTRYILESALDISIRISDDRQLVLSSK